MIRERNRLSCDKCHFDFKNTIKCQRQTVECSRKPPPQTLYQDFNKRLIRSLSIIDACAEVHGQVLLGVPSACCTSFLKGAFHFLMRIWSWSKVFNPLIILFCLIRWFHQERWCPTPFLDNLPAFCTKNKCPRPSLVAIPFSVLSGITS